MKAEYTISIYLDTRRPKNNDLYPVKLRVYDTITKKRKLYPTNFDYSKKDFASIWESNNPKGEFKKKRLELNSLEVHAYDIARTLDVFSFEDFEKRLRRKKGSEVLVDYHFNKAIEDFRKKEQLGAVESNTYSRKAFETFYSKGSKKFEALTFKEITVDFLNDFEKYMLDNGRTLTTVGYYTRALRAIFNNAISEGDIDSSVYPFGKKKYRIPKGKSKKKALNDRQLKILFDAKPLTPEQEKAKSFWFFSYACNGMNLKDITLLKNKDINDGKFEFIRAKTALTSKVNQKTITVHLNPFSLSVIEKYGNIDKSPDSYVFDIINDRMTAEKKKSTLNNFTRFVNQHMKKICLANDLPIVSTYWARHSFATKIVRDGASLELASESLGHSSLSVTQGYFAGFDDEVRKEMSEGLMKF